MYDPGDGALWRGWHTNRCVSWPCHTCCCVHVRRSGMLRCVHPSSGVDVSARSSPVAAAVSTV